LLGVPRSIYYYQPRPESAENLRLLRQLDQLYLKRPRRMSWAQTAKWPEAAILYGRVQIRHLNLSLANYKMGGKTALLRYYGPGRGRLVR
jgi:hypothetical protein